MKKHLKLEIEGIVQGVGFRPHVFNMAVSFGLFGYVLNDSRGVTIEAEAPEDVLIAFREHLIQNPPPLADLQSVRWKIADKLEGYDEFAIKRSTEIGAKTVLISPDIATCGDCLREMQDPSDPRYRYPFINCTNCGPRFTIITDVPYDRKNTSMAQFPMCPLCEGQYEDPRDRRFHAQPVACPVCGPRLFLTDSAGNEVESYADKVIGKAALLLRAGKILAIKGLGGYHLAVNAENEIAVTELRKRKIREDKPFAVMALNLETARRYCEINVEEGNLLNSYRSPIVLLKKRSGAGLADQVAPGNPYLGMMLAYTPFHHLLLSEFSGLLVMTSGNLSDEPIAYQDEEARERLSGIADYFLTHNRPINTRCDDSVTRVFQGNEYILRRSRGYTPFPIILNREAPVPILAVGGHLKNTFCLYRKDQAFVSHHIGDLENTETLKSFTEGIEHYKRLFDIEPQAVAHDLHPRYLSTEFAQSLAIGRKIRIQHHHAHTASVMVENGLEGEVIGISLDGVGYGDDEKLWGCEFLKSGYTSFERFIHLKYIPLPGGESAIKEPWRTAVSFLYDAYGDEIWNRDLSLFKTIPHAKIIFILHMIAHQLESPMISSAGRLFDAISSIIGIRHFCNYEGQAAIEMEMATDLETKESYPFSILQDRTPYVIDPSQIIRAVVGDLERGMEKSVIAGKFHNTVAGIVVAGAKIVREAAGLDNVALSGGVFQNMILLEKSKRLLQEDGFIVHIHKRVPTNDGGISLGQAAIAAAIITQERKAR